MLPVAASRRLTGRETPWLCMQNGPLSVNWFRSKSGMRNSRREDEEVKTVLRVYNGKKKQGNSSVLF